MSRIISRLMMCLLCAGCLVGAGYSQAVKSAAWYDLTSIEGRFQVTLPARPQQSSKEVESSTGKSAYQQFAVQTSDAFFGVTYSDETSYLSGISEEQRRAAYDRIRDGHEEQAKGAVLISERDIVYDGQLGREMTIKFKDGISVRHRVVFSGIRFYQLIATYYTAAQRNAATQGKINRFMNSFRITAPAADQPTAVTAN